MHEGDTLIGLTEMQRLLGYEEKSGVCRLVKTPGFPAHVVVPGMHGRRWWRSEVIDYIESCRGRPVKQTPRRRREPAASTQEPA